MIIGEKYHRIVNGLGNYIYGHPLEIIQDLSEKARNKTLREERFPLIALFLDISEGKDRFSSHWDVDTLKVVLIQDTKPEYKAAKRTRETFEPVLLPLFDSVISAMENSALISWNGEFERTLRYYWGRERQNAFNDFIDAIEIDFTGIKVNDLCGESLTISETSAPDGSTLYVSSTHESLSKNDFLIVETNTANDYLTLTDLGGGDFELDFENDFVDGDYFILKVMTENGRESNYLTIRNN